MNKNNNWDLELLDQSKKYFIIFTWLSIFIVPMWGFFDYFAIKSHWKEFVVARFSFSLIQIPLVILCKKDKISPIILGYIATAILYVGIGLGLPFLSVAKEISAWCISYSTCFITLAIFQMWRPKHHIFSMLICYLVIAFSLIFFGRPSIGEYISNGLLLTISISLVSSALFYIRYELTKKNFFLNQELEKKVNELKEKNDEINEMMVQREIENKKNIDLQIQLSEAKNFSNIGVLAAGMAHEFGNKLGAMVNAFKAIKKMIETNQIDKEKVLLAINIFEQSSEKAKIVINSIIKPKNEFKTGNGQTSIKECVEMALMLNRGHYLEKIVIHNKVPADAVTNLEPEFLTQTLVNLILNSIQALEGINNGVIEIEFEKGQNDIFILIKDNGKGISDKDESQIFNAYFTTKKNGSGIGLYFHKKEMNKVGGDIFIYNKKDPTTFKILLPQKGSSL